LETNQEAMNKQTDLEEQIYFFNT